MRWIYAVLSNQLEPFGCSKSKHCCPVSRPYACINNICIGNVLFQKRISALNYI